jgi:hypothetical protein
VILLAVALVAAAGLGACGGGTPSAAPTGGGDAPSVAPGTVDGAGAALGAEILGTFDALVAEVAAAASAKPAPEELAPALETIYASYATKMADLNAEYRALRDSDIAEFGACNTYLGNERGKHVLAKDTTLTDVVKYYNLELGNQEMVALLSTRPVELLDIAVKQD